MRRRRVPVGEVETYERRCDECREPYAHAKGACTGFCPGCEDAIREESRAVPPLVVEHFHLPFVQEFDEWHWP